MTEASERVYYGSIERTTIPDNEKVVVEDYEDILNNVLDRVDNKFDKREGSIIYDSCAPMSFEMFKQKSLFRDILELAFACTSEGYYLDLIGKDYGVKRYDAEKAKLKVRFTGRPNTVIYKDTMVGMYNNDDFYFLTNEEVEIDESGVVEVDATCNIEGKVRNVGIGQITLLLDTRYNGEITAVTNTTQDYGGINKESDDEFRARILYLKQNANYGGTLTDFKQWAFSVQGVTYVEVFDKPRGIGTVDVVISTTYEIDESRVLEEVTNKIMENSQCGLDIQVKLVDKTPVTITIKVEGISASVAYDIATDYVNNISIGGTIYLSDIITKIKMTGATDVIIVEPAENFVLPSGSIPLATINVTEIN